MDTTQRIAQFENMVRDDADPNNDMAWFMLAGAYSQAERHADAANAYLRCVSINPAMSKGWQLAGQAYISAGDKEKAAQVLTDGYKSAASRGDRMPQKAMGDLLTKLGRPIPEVAGAKSAAATGERKQVPAPSSAPAAGRPGTKMARQPFKGPVGEWIAANISKGNLRRLDRPGHQGHQRTAPRSLPRSG
jgi:tetratricopeptide (TPR) repeat protein